MFDMCDVFQEGIPGVKQDLPLCLTTRRLVEALMELKTKMWLYNTEGHVRTGKVVIKWGIFQGDSLSLLLLCLALASLITVLNKQGAGYEVNKKNKVSHLCYMDDFKLFSRDKTELQKELTTVKTFTNDI